MRRPRAGPPPSTRRPRRHGALPAGPRAQVSDIASLLPKTRTHGARYKLAAFLPNRSLLVKAFMSIASQTPRSPMLSSRLHSAAEPLTERPLKSAQYFCAVSLRPSANHSAHDP